jgi:hypothetical protein
MRVKAAYQRTFCGDGVAPHKDAELVLADLRRFAHIDDGGIVVSPVTRTTDSHATCYRAGLRDAYLRLALMLGLGEADRFDNSEENPNHVETAQT